MRRGSLEPRASVRPAAIAALCSIRRRRCSWTRGAAGHSRQFQQDECGNSSQPHLVLQQFDDPPLDGRNRRSGSWVMSQMRPVRHGGDRRSRRWSIRLRVIEGCSNCWPHGACAMIDPAELLHFEGVSPPGSSLRSWPSPAETPRNGDADHDSPRRSRVHRALGLDRRRARPDPRHARTRNPTTSSSPCTGVTWSEHCS